jgi:hypothetical protein
MEAPVAEAKGFGSLSFNSVKEMAKTYSDNVKAQATNAVGAHKAQLFGEATNMGASIKGIGSEKFGKIKSFFSGAPTGETAAPAAAAGGRRTRRRKSSRKSKGKRKSTKRSKRSRKSKTNNKKKSKRVRFSLRRR